MDSTPSPVRVVSSRTIRPPARAREMIPLTAWDVSLLAADYIQKGLLFPPPPFANISGLLDHLHASLVDALAIYYPVAGRFTVDKQQQQQDHHQADDVTGSSSCFCSVSIECAGQGAEMVHAVADGVSIGDVLPPDADVPHQLVRSFFPLNHAINYDGVEVPLLAVQVTELDDGVFLGFAYNHALSDGTAFWNFLNAWAHIARGRGPPASSPLLQRWSPDGGGGAAAPVLLPCADLAGLTATRTTPPVLRERMLHFSAESLAALKERARQELLASGDAAGAAAVTKFQALSSLLWRCVTRARRHAPDQEVVFRASANNRGRLRPPLPAEYFGNSISAVSTGAVPASELLAAAGGHGWAAAAVGRAVAAHTDAAIRAGSAAAPSVSAFRLAGANAMFVSSSPRFDMYGCDFGWGKPLAARSGKANKYDGKVSLFPGREGGGSIDAELELTPEHMAALEHDAEFWAAVSPDAPKP